jgi:hypothetical protein
VAASRPQRCYGRRDNDSRAGPDVWQLSIVGFLSVSHGSNVYDPFRVIYGVDDAIVTYANSPEIVFATKLAAAARTRLSCKGFNLGEDALNDGGR